MLVKHTVNITDFQVSVSNLNALCQHHLDKLRKAWLLILWLICVLFTWQTVSVIEVITHKSSLLAASVFDVKPVISSPMIQSTPRADYQIYLRVKGMWMGMTTE